MFIMGNSRFTRSYVWKGLIGSWKAHKKQFFPTGAKCTRCSEIIDFIHYSDLLSYSFVSGLLLLYQCLGGHTAGALVAEHAVLVSLGLQTAIPKTLHRLLEVLNTATLVFTPSNLYQSMIKGGSETIP